MIYKIITQTEWNVAQSAGKFNGSAVDLKDGFIHFSSALQVKETAAKHFSGQDDLVILAVNEDLLGSELRWEVSRGGDLFPHLYSSLNLQHVEQSSTLKLGADGHHIFPSSIVA